MKTIKLLLNQKTGEVLNVEKIPEQVMSKITSFYLLTKRNRILSPEQRSEIAKKAAKASAIVRTEKARLRKLSQVD